MDSTIKVFDVRRIVDKAHAASMGATWDPGLGQSTLLSSADSCIRTFAVHTASVKRGAVMSDHPFEFLSCSEDGTARHFDIREPAPLSNQTHRASLRGGRVIANYSSMNAELHAIDTNSFRSSIFAVGGSMSSIMVHDRRMVQPNSKTGEGSRDMRNWTGERCIVRLRVDAHFDGDEVYEHTSENIVTGLRFSRDVPNQLVGSWCYDHIYLFDLNYSSSYLNAIGTSLCDSSKRSRSRRGSVDFHCLPEAKRTCKCGSSADFNSTGSSSNASRASYYVIGHGCICAASNDREQCASRESVDKQVSGNIDPNMDICDICQIKKAILEDACLELEQSQQTLSSICEAALPATEREFVNAAFNAFVSNMATGVLLHAKDAISFAIRQLEDEGIEPSVQSLQKADRSLSGDILHIEDGTCIERMLACLSTDAGLERRRIRSLLHNNRACISATRFRQKWVRLFEDHLRDIQPHSIAPRSIEYLLGEIDDIRNRLYAAIRDCNASMGYNRFNMLACFNRVLLVWDSARIDCIRLILQLRYMLTSNDLRSIIDGSQDLADDNRSSAQINQLRAEFGELKHRLSELGTKLRVGLADIRAMSCEINGFCVLADSLRKCDFNNYALARLYHKSERFFEISKGLADRLSLQASQILALFERTVQAFENSVVGSGHNATDYSVAMDQVLLGFGCLSRPLSVDCCNESSRSFGKRLFEHHDSALGHSPLLYLWHSTICLEASSEHKDDLGISVLPTYPFDKPFSRLKPPRYTASSGSAARTMAESDDNTRISIDSLYSVPANDLTIVDSDSSNERDHGGHSNGEKNTCNSESGGSSTQGTDPRASMHMRNSSISAESAIVSSPDEMSWPRNTLEYFIRKGRRPLLAKKEVYMRDSGNYKPETLLLPCRKYTGHCNFQTTKDVNFVFDRYIASGSDDGHVFIWDRDSMDIVQIIRGDHEIVNIVEGHPSLPLIAVSGIDSEIHLFSLPQGGGPSSTHRQKFPLVRDRHFSSIGVYDPTARAALKEMIYAPDPYFKALRYSGHSLLPMQIDPSEVSKSIEREFPAVSESRLSNKDTIIGENEDMRFTGLAHTSLTRQIMTNIMLGSMFSRSYSDTSSSNNSSVGDYETHAGETWSFEEEEEEEEEPEEEELEIYEDESDDEVASEDYSWYPESP
ncbi:hypothetical protein LPJ64_003104 [Coemansia asiatica]|uniref:Uncharacterized protein n=1 Tax=Coemansia asiatica TaxID=1052880 RepID=A0A9W8CKD5_9FUNG|nr:hypothetical protein LPJ64_003104 [Coemansia asiatica]